ncbi:DMT family transporter [Thiobacillus sp.]|uniref:DMT family transporter n=1 Tax=Thiobacillus sp. TaxID=924 RepID=UPI0025F61CD6|nr:DMT family transporter [Thiobacillus sp.]
MTRMSIPTGRVYLAVTITTFFWGANFVLAGWVLEDLSPDWASALRFLFGAGLMSVLAWWRGENLAGLARRYAANYLLLGLVGIVGFNLLFFRAMQTTSADNGALIMATNPLLTTLLAAATLRERVSAKHWAALPIALSGVAIVITHGELARLQHLQIVEGDLLMLGANLTWAAFNICSRRFSPNASAIANTALMMSTGALVLLAIAAASGAALSMPGPQAFSALVIMTIAGTVLAYLFWGIGIRQLGAGRTSLFLNLVPVFAMLVGASAGEWPNSAQITGGALVLTGMIIAILPARQGVMVRAGESYFPKRHHE